MRVLVVQSCAAETAGRYHDQLVRRGVETRTVHPYRGEPLPSPDDFDAFVVGGTPVSANDALEHPFLTRIRDYLAALVERDARVLGICCGGQLLAAVCGARVRRHPHMEIGIVRVHRTAEGRRDLLLAGFPDVFEVFHWHADVFDLPASGRLLVAGDDCENQLFRVGRAVGVLFHLEVSAGGAARFADAYPDELARYGPSRARLIADCHAADPQMTRLAGRLVDNLLSL